MIMLLLSHILFSQMYIRIRSQNQRKFMHENGELLYTTLMKWEEHNTRELIIFGKVSEMRPNLRAISQEIGMYYFAHENRVQPA